MPKVQPTGVHWLVVPGVVVTVVLIYVNLPDRGEVLTVVLEPKVVQIDPHFEALIERDLRKIVEDFGKWGQPAYLEDIEAGDQGVEELKKRFFALFKARNWKKKKFKHLPVTCPVTTSMAQRFAINVNVSDRIPYTRELPDPRPFSCRDKKNDEYKNLPTASIIIVTRNEAWSMIVRTLHSVVERTPANLIQEVIIVDDGSSYPGMNYDLMAKLDYYVSTKLPKYMRMIRMGSKSGIVPARLHGAKQATGEVLVFLDAHSEVNDDWLEPLLDRIKSNPKVVVQPVVDAVDWDTFEYSPFISNHHVFNGAFTWAGGFEWLEMSIPDILKRSDHAAPHKNPVMAGGLFAIQRNYFWDVGSYDEQMYDWGFENIEMSIRIWTCGGTMEIVPCSRVGHVFHSNEPEILGENSTRSRQASFSFNAKRTIKVWFDDYERLVYQYRPSLKNVDPGDITARQDFRKNHHCKPFEWYVTEVLHKFVMDRGAKYSGRLMSDTGFCLTHATQYEASESIPILLPCDSNLSARQYWALSKNDSELRREFLCALPHVDISTKTFGLRLKLCDDFKKIKWTYHEANRTLVQNRAKECLDSLNGKYPVLSPCHPKKPSQKWTFIDNATLNVF